MQANSLENTGRAAKRASFALAGLSAAAKNAVLLTLADLLESSADEILRANAKDLEQAKAGGMDSAMLDRLALDAGRIKGIAGDVRSVSALADPVGQIILGRRLDNGIELVQKRVPLGVVAAIYEARPNVTVDVAALCLKTGNAVILRGGKETRNSNEALTAIIRRALDQHGLPPDAVQAITDPDHELVKALLKLDKYVDMLIPRGGAGLQQFCRENSTIPVITGGIGVCHIFVDKSARLEPSLEVIANAKVQRPSVCNSVETVLVHADIAADFLPRLHRYLTPMGVTLHPTPRAAACLDPLPYEPVKEGEFDREWLTLDLNVEVVDDLEGAVEHIREHGSGHSDAILTESMSNAERFVTNVDTSSVYVNASTRFTDGGQFGLGAEVAISTQKLHARGPMALEALTSSKWIAHGDYTVRK